MSIKNIPYIIHEAPMAIASSEIVSENNGKIIAQTILQDLGVQNRNRRIYLPNDLLPELRASRAMELLETGNLKGELGHPMSQELSRQQTIDPVLVCCKYLKLSNKFFYVSYFMGRIDYSVPSYNFNILYIRLTTINLHST